MNLVFWSQLEIKCSWSRWSKNSPKNSYWLLNLNSKCSLTSSIIVQMWKISISLTLLGFSRNKSRYLELSVLIDKLPNSKLLFYSISPKALLFNQRPWKAVGIQSKRTLFTWLLECSKQNISGNQRFFQSQIQNHH